MPSWSTNFKIPCTFAFILNTCRDKEDCKVRNEASSADCGVVDDAAREEGDSPVSISAKLIAVRG